MLEITVAEEETEEVEPFNGNALEYLQSIYRNPAQEQYVRMRAARDAIAYESPKLIATAQISGQSFAAILERRYLHMRKVQAELIEAPNEPKPKPDPAPAKPPLPHVFDRRYRRV
jgi:hypothetical protein